MKFPVSARGTPHPLRTRGESMEAKWELATRVHGTVFEVGGD